tara:strand:- start:281 stop:445 length:165 start_codon:yes stop_codon:yes gene_type:complete
MSKQNLIHTENHDLRTSWTMQTDDLELLIIASEADLTSVEWVLDLQSSDSHDIS